MYHYIIWLYLIPCLIYFFGVRFLLKIDEIDREEVSLLVLVLNFTPIINLIIITLSGVILLVECAKDESFSVKISQIYYKEKEVKKKEL